MDYRAYYNEKKAQGAYISHNAGDICSFRYPHLKRFKEYFSFDKDFNYWRLNSEKGDIIREFASEDITVWEFLSPSARKLHFYDMTAAQYTDSEREKAFEDVLKGYENRGSAFPESEHRVISLNELKVREGFEYIRELYCGVAALPVHFLNLSGVEKFPFGSVLKGTDIVVTDGSALNFGQDMLHALYHLKEGIPGAYGNNNYVDEIWAEVPSLYAMQLSEGRISRRKRQRPTPHIIRFSEYVFLRAYLGLAFVDEDCAEYAHRAFSVIEPSVRLMLYPLRNESVYNRIRILADAVLEDKTNELKGIFESEFGKNSFESIFGSWSLYGKYKTAMDFCCENKLDEIMFDGESLLNTDCSREIIRTIWKDEEARNENIALLSACK